MFPSGPPEGVECTGVRSELWAIGRDNVSSLANEILQPKYVQDDAVWVERGRAARQRGKCCSTWAETYEVALSSQGVRVVQEQGSLSLRTKKARDTDGVAVSGA